MVFLPSGYLNAWSFWPRVLGAAESLADARLTEAEVGTSHESGSCVVGWASRLSQGQAARAHCYENVILNVFEKL